MFGIGATEIVVMGLLITVPLVLMFLLVFASRRGGKAAAMEETQLMQEVLRGMKRLEERIDSMETILMERRGKD